MRQMSSADIRSLARGYVAALVKSILRARVLRLERGNATSPQKIEAAQTYLEHKARMKAALIRKKMEWSEELLREKFAINFQGDKVIWGKATVAQHLARLDMLRVNMTANLEAIWRHEIAIEQIQKAGTRNLDAALKKRVA